MTLPALEKLDAFPEDIPELSAYDRENPVAPLSSEIKYEPEKTVTFPSVLLTLWALGMLAFFAVRMWRLLNSKLRLARSLPVAKDAPLYQELESLCQHLGIKPTPWLLHNELIRGPQATGYFSPAILLPFHFGNYPAEQRQMMLVHELAHIQRKDMLWRASLEGIAIVFWFHPLVWLVLRRLDEQTEKACDDAVLQANYPASKYAETMLAALKPPSPQGAITQPSQAGAPAALRGRMFGVLDKAKHRLPLTTGSMVRFLLLFSLIILPLSLISFSPYPANQSYETVNGHEDLKAAWRMKLGRGTILPDSSGNEHHGNIYGAQWVKDPVRGHCLSFDGIDDHLILRAPEMSWNRKPFTLSVWLKPSPNSDGGGLLLRGDRNLTWCSALGSKVNKNFGEREFLLAGKITSGAQYSQSSKGLMLLYNSWGVALTQAEKAIQPDQWNHLAFTWRPAGNSALVQIYLNGKLAGVRHTQEIETSSHDDWPAKVWHFGLGESPISATNNYEGLVSDLAVFQKSLTAKEVRQVMCGDFALKGARTSN